MLTCIEVQEAINKGLGELETAQSLALNVDSGRLIESLMLPEQVNITESTDEEVIEFSDNDASIATKFSKRVLKLDLSVPDKEMSFEEKVLCIIQGLLKRGIIFGKDNSGGLYYYQEDTGHFVLLHRNSVGTPNSFSAFLMNTVDESFRITVTTSKVANAVYQYLMERDNVSQNLPEIPDSRYVNLKNGVLDLKTLELADHSPEYGFKFCVDANFIKEQNLGKVSQDFLEKLAFSQKERVALLQVIGLALSNIRDRQVSPFIVGEPANGKSTLCNFLQSLIPEECSIATSFDSWKDRFHAVNFSTAHFSICADMSTAKLTKNQQAMFKVLVAGDRYGARRIYENFGSVRSRCLMIFAGNGVPYFDDLSGALMRRIWYIKTGSTVPEELRDPRLLDFLIEDKDPIVSKALIAIAKVFNNEETFVKSEFDDSTGLENLPAEVFVKKWVDENIRENVDSYVALGTLYERFLDDTGFEEKLLPYTGFCKKIRACFQNSCFKKRENVAALCGYQLMPKARPELLKTQASLPKKGYWF